MDEDYDDYDDGDDGPEPEPCPECNGDMDLNSRRTEWYCEGCDITTEYAPQAQRHWDDGDDPADYPIDGVGFAEPGGNSALRAATKSNPRNLPCPTCHRPNMLTPIDRQRGYQCNGCANAEERGF